MISSNTLFEDVTMKKIICFWSQTHLGWDFASALSYLRLITSSPVFIHTCEFLTNGVSRLIKWNSIKILKEGEDNNENYHPTGDFKSSLVSVYYCR